jgi:hypothetical protein
LTDKLKKAVASSHICKCKNIALFEGCSIKSNPDYKLSDGKTFFAGQV